MRACARSADGRVWCWGERRYLNLISTGGPTDDGDGDCACRQAPGSGLAASFGLLVLA